MFWYNDLAAHVQQRVDDVDWVSMLETASFEITSRPKTIDTLRQKLLRDKDMPLLSVQDIAGVRFEAEMSLDQQDAVAVAVAGLFGHGIESIRDLRERPHSGYRAVHVWLRLPARVEVQIRTHLQGAWANAYEAAADVLGRGIRYGELPNGLEERAVVQAMQKLSLEQIAMAELERSALQRDLWRLKEEVSAGVPLYLEQVQARLEREWGLRRAADQETRESLESIHDQFRSLRGRG